MIYGSVGLTAGIMHSGNEWRTIEKNVTWPESCSYRFSFGSFSGVFITGSDRPPESGEVFYGDEEIGMAVLVDGFVYNGAEIIRSLSTGEHPFKTPELIAKAYLKWGSGFAEKLNGDFAFCVFLEKERKALLYRDHLGIRPLAASLTPTALFFASDPMGLCKALSDQYPIDKDYLVNLFLLPGHDYARLPVREVASVPPGHYLLTAGGKSESHPYWFPEKIPEDITLTRRQVMQELPGLLADAVAIRTDQRFTAAAHVSGGLDSGIVAALARKACGHQPLFYGFSWSPDRHSHPPKGQRDERSRVEETCLLNDITPVFTGFDASGYLAFFADWRHPSEMVFEKPVVEMALTKGVNLIFSGWGGDEFISIADRGIDADLLRNGQWGLLLQKYPPHHPRKFFAALSAHLNLLSRRRNYAMWKTEKTVYPYLKKVIGSNRVPRQLRFHHHSRREVHLQLLALGHLAARTSDWYVHGQRNGIEYRYPLLDKRIVEYMLKVPSRCLANGGKDRIILRELGKGLLPDSVLRHVSKEDISISRLFRSISVDLKKEFSRELPRFRRNPHLSFVDFARLEKEQTGLLSGAEKNGAINSLSIFYYLKKADDFSKYFLDDIVRHQDK